MQIYKYTQMHRHAPIQQVAKVLRGLSEGNFFGQLILDLLQIYIFIYTQHKQIPKKCKYIYIRTHLKQKKVFEVLHFFPISFLMCLGGFKYLPLVPQGPEICVSERESLSVTALLQVCEDASRIFHGLRDELSSSRLCLHTV